MVSNKLRTTERVADLQRLGRPKITDEFEAINECCTRSPRKTIRRTSRE